MVLLETIAQGALIPAKQAEELLEIPWRLADGVGHRLDTLSGQITQLALDVEVQIAMGGDSAEAVIELPQERLCSYLLHPDNESVARNAECTYPFPG
jgi:hypothetical protein